MWGSSGAWGCAYLVWVLRGALFNVGVEVSEGCCVCDGLLGVLLSCIVGWGVIIGLTGVMLLVLCDRGVVTGVFIYL